MTRNARELRKRLLDDAIELPRNVFLIAPCAIRFYRFDEFLYECVRSPERFGLAEFRSEGLGLEVLEPDRSMFINTYGEDPIAELSFFGRDYDALIYREFRPGAHTIEILADRIAWFGLQGSWCAYGSRDFGIVALCVTHASAVQGSARSLSIEALEHHLAAEMGSSYRDFIEKLRANYCF